MERIMTYETLRSFAYSNDRLIKGDIRGLVFHFCGLGYAQMISEDDDTAKRYAKEGLLYIVPYLNPWAWMNRQSVAYADETVDVLFSHYRLPDDTPIVASGGSMGGQQSLVYTVYAKRTPVACVVNCPVCDLPYHYTERPDLPRTLYSAFGSYDMTLREALESASPLHLADRLPKNTAYCFFHCEEDKSVNIDKHTKTLLKKIEDTLHPIFYSVPGRGHCDLTDEMWEKYHQQIIQHIINA